MDLVFTLIATLALVAVLATLGLLAAAFGVDSRDGSTR